MDVTRAQLAEMVGVSLSTVSRWEDDLRNPEEEALAKLASVLQVTPAWLRYGAEPMRPEVETSAEQRAVTERLKREAEAEIEEREKARHKAGAKQRKPGRTA